MEFKITKEFIIEAHKAACSDWKKRIESEFPEAFPKALQLGKWYKFYYHYEPNILRALLFITIIDGDEAWFNYGIDVSEEENVWLEKDWYNKGHKFIECTPEEVCAALEKEIIKRFGEDWENAKIEAHADGGHWIGNGLNKGGFASGIGKHKVFSKHGVLYSNGVFAKPLPIEKTVITREKALKILAKKLKVSPENIEIK